MTPLLEKATITFAKNDYKSNSFAKSGPIKCDKGFKVRFDLRTPEPDRKYGIKNFVNYWAVGVYLIDSQVPLDDYFDMKESVKNKEDPSVHCYGVYPTWLWSYNLKQEWAKEKVEDERG